MRSFLRTVVAVAAGVLLSMLLVLGVTYLRWGRPPEIHRGSILEQRVSGPIAEYPPDGITSGLFAPSAPTLYSILRNLSNAAVDDRIRGVLLVTDHPGAGFAALDEIRGAVAAVRAAGKPVWAWSDNLGLKDLYLASACDSFFVHPAAYVDLGGMFAGSVHVSRALEKLGIQPQVSRIESYKSAAEMVTRPDLSPQAKEMLEWVEGDIFPRVLEATAGGLGVDRDVLLGAMREAVPLPQVLVDEGIADGVRYRDEMDAALPRDGGRERPRLVAAADYRRIDTPGGKKGKKIAVVHADGLITGEESGWDPFLGPVMGYRSVNADLREALQDKDVVGVIFRVDSRGGESITSDRIGRMVEVVDRKKPVVVSMVDVAASGGYTISYRARTLLAGANTLTGSIGIITGKFVLKDFYAKLGITKDGVGTGPNPDFYSDVRAWTPEEMGRVRDREWASYRAWIADIARCRKMEPAEVDSVGRGRVWTGAQALDRGLIDGLGGLDAAVDAVRKEAGLAPDARVQLVDYPRPRGFLENVLGLNLATAPQRTLAAWVGRSMGRAQSLSRERLEMLSLPVP